MNEEKRRQLLPSAEEELAAARTIHLQFGNCEIIWRKARKGKLIAYCLLASSYRNVFLLDFSSGSLKICKGSQSLLKRDWRNDWLTATVLELKN
jgi:hypothetical protein